MRLSKEITEAVHELIHTDSPFMTSGEISEELWPDFRDRVLERNEQVGKAWFAQKVKAALNKTTVFESQTHLDGFEFPTTITVEVDESRRVEYVPFERANRDQAYRHIRMKDINIKNANEEKRRYLDLLQRLEDAVQWEQNPDLTAGQIVEQIKSSEAAA